ncbi:hypothetical protein ABZ723_34275 [Streptomyces sp. NPDC006700]
MRHEPAMGYSRPQDPVRGRNDRQSRSPAMATALTCSKKLAKLAT